MASFTTSNASNNSVGRELSIASSFVKQYYTLLNKAPHFIHNFYSNDSTFIHGTIEMANEHYTEPIVGREKIKKKMKDLKLVDCRAKIKQIDCLETLAGGYVIQVVGELSNNGRPMRRFLQTFVLAQSAEESRTDGDQARVAQVDRRGVNLSENNTSSSHQKFFVLNSIFRYQDDGSENEFDNETVNLHANASVDNDNAEKRKKEVSAKSAHDELNVEKPNGGLTSQNHAQSTRTTSESNKDADVERVTKDFERGIKFNRNPAEVESKQQDVDTKIVSNGTSKIDKKSETTEKPTVNGGLNASNANTIAASSANPIASSAAVARTQPSNEPKTWANMVRNHPATSSIQTNASKPNDQAQNQSQSTAAPVNNQQQPPLPNMQNNSNNNVGNNRRRHMMRKPSNKTTGRTLKNRHSRPPAQQQQPPQQGKPAA